MAIGRLDIFDSYAEDALKKFGMEQTCTAKMLQVSENITYMVKNKVTGANEAVMRISRPGYHTLEELNAEIKWLREIKKYTPLIVASPIKGKNGFYVQLIHSWMADQTFACVLYEFLEGHAPDESDEQNVIRQFADLGEATAWLHRQSRMWNDAKYLERWTMDYDTMIGAHPMWGRWQEAEDLTKDGLDTLTKASTVIQSRLERFGKARHDFGLIHADLRLANLLVEGDRIKVIDFDDCGFGWYLHDLAGAVSFIEDKPITPELIHSWLDGYRRVEPFSKQEYEEIDTFVMQRRLQLLAWITSHSDSDPVKELSIGFTDGTLALAERYLKKFA